MLCLGMASNPEVNNKMNNKVDGNVTPKPESKSKVFCHSVYVGGGNEPEKSELLKVSSVGVCKDFLCFYTSFSFVMLEAEVQLFHHDQ